MSEYDEATIAEAGKLLVQVLRLRKRLRAGGALTWCEPDEVGRYSLDTLVQNLSAISINDGDNDIPIAKLLR
jgi:hypothetical protein